MSKHLETCELRAVALIGGIVSATPDRQAAAAEVLEVIRRFVPYVAASVQAWNPVRWRHEMLASTGYPSEAVSHLDNWFVESDEAYRYMRDVDPQPLRWRDMPFDYRRLYSASTIWIPLGFDEGVTTCLFDSRGRYTGNLHIGMDDRRYPSDSAMDALLVLQSTLSGLTDVLRTPSATVHASGAIGNAVIVTANGVTVAVPGYPSGAHLAPEGALTKMIAATIQASAVVVQRFLWRDGDGEWHRVRLEPVDGGILAIESPTVLPAHLTAREIDVLTLVCEGYSNADIGAALNIRTKTVAKHVEHLLEKLECGSRTALASCALRTGLVRVASTGAATNGISEAGFQMGQVQTAGQRAHSEPPGDH